MKNYDLNLFDYWRIIRKRKWIVTFTLLATIIFTWFSAEITPNQYKARSVIKVEERFTIEDLLMGRRTPAPATADAMTVTGYEIIEEVVKKLGLVKEDASRLQIDKAVRYIQTSVRAGRVKDTQNYIEIEAISDDPQRVADIANTIAETFIIVDTQEKSKEARLVRQYIEKQLELTKEKLEEAENSLWDTTTKIGLATDRDAIFARLSEMQLKLAELAEVFTEDHPKIIALKKQIQNQREQLGLISESDLKTKRLKGDIEIHRKLYAMLREELEKVSISEVGKVTAAIIIDRAQIPSNPIGAPKTTKIFLGIVMGLITGMVLAFVKEQLDTSIATIDDVEEYIKLPVLGIIPHKRAEEIKESNKGWDKLIGGSLKKEREIKTKTFTLYRPNSPGAESYRTLRTNICFAIAKDKSKVLLFTSSGPSEGKSTVVINLAITIARAGTRVLLISANLRRPSICDVFGIKREPGLSDILIERLTWQESLRSLPDFLKSQAHREVIERSPELDNLKIITSGHRPPNPSELLASSEMDRLLKEAREKFDIILLDSPPTLPVTDAGILASKVDRVIIVYQVGKTARSALYRTKVRLESLGAKICGVVLNNIRTEADIGGATYYYHYKYYREERPRLRNKFRKYNAIFLTLKRRLKSKLSK